MKKIGEATILIVADVIPYVPFPIRSIFLFCSRSIVSEEQSSLRKSYSPNSIFCSYALFEYPPFAQKAGIVYSHNGIKMNIA